MFFRSAAVALLASYVSATKMLDIDSDIPVSSNFGQEIMMKATVIKEARILNNNNNDYSWMADYSIKYLGCTSLVQIAAEGNNNNKNNDGGMLYSQHLVRFNLCPSTSCSSSCTGGGEYVVNMMDFVDSYTEAKLTEQEYKCELVREACYCENANDDQVCENQCYTDAAMTECIEYEGENEEFEVQRYLECQEMKAEGGNNNNNNNNNYYYGGNGDYYYGSYYIGPYCPDGKSIYLGLFYDAGCSAQADIAQYAARNYGVELPYSKTSLVKANDCIACKEVEVNDNGYETISIAEVCSDLWSGAARCETNLASGTAPYPDSYGCDYIENILPKLDAASRSVGTNKSSYVIKEGRAGKAFAFIFAFTTILFAAYAYFLYRKIKRGVVALASQS